MLETRGAKSGALRRNAVVYFHDGDRVTIVASKLGYPKHPAWFHNLRANSDANREIPIVQLFPRESEPELP